MVGPPSFPAKTGNPITKDTLLGILAQVEINHLNGFDVFCILNILEPYQMLVLMTKFRLVWISFKDLAKEFYIVPWFWAHARPNDWLFHFECMSPWCSHKMISLAIRDPSSEIPTNLPMQGSVETNAFWRILLLVEIFPIEASLKHHATPQYSIPRTHHLEIPRSWMALLSAECERPWLIWWCLWHWAYSYSVGS